MPPPYRRRIEIHAGPEWVYYRGEDHVTGMTYCVKEAVQPPVDLVRVETRLTDEQEFVHKLSHDRILRLHTTDAPKLRIVYEDAVGTLSTYLKQSGPLPPDLVVGVLTHLLRGLKYLHECRLGHGGIHAARVFLAPDGSVKLGAFIGYWLSHGTPVEVDEPLPYQAPEVLDPSFGPCGPQADLYCVGFLAIEMLLGCDTNRERPLDWHIDPRTTQGSWRDRLSGVPVPLAEFIDSLVERSPDERLPTAKVALKTLEKIGIPGTLKLPPPGSLSKGKSSAGKPAGEGAPDEVRLPLRLLHNEEGSQLVESFGTDQTVLVGAGADCELPLAGSDVSLKHAIFVCLAEGWWLIDLKAATKVNGSPIRRRLLKHGDRIEFGSAERFVDFKPRSGSGAGLSEFKILEKLHAGSNGEVYKAMWSLKGGERLVALRIFPPDFDAEETDVQRFIRGNHAAGEMRHPNLVRLYRGGRSRNHSGQRVWYLSMEFMAGGSVRDRVTRDGPMAVAVVIEWGRAIATALAAVRDKGMVHRNVNSANILFTEDNTAKLGDFKLLKPGAGAQVTTYARTHEVLDDKLYHSPEQLRGKADVGPSTDQYGLAAVMYFALTARPPFVQSGLAHEVVLAMLKEPPLPPSVFNRAIPPALDAVLLKALEKKPEDRFASPEAFAMALADCEE